MFILMISFAILIWIASGKNSTESSLLAQVCGIPPSPHDKLLIFPLYIIKMFLFKK